MDRFLNRISEEELKEQRESAGEDAQFLDLKYQEVDRDTPLDISGISTEKGASSVLGVKLLHQEFMPFRSKPDVMRASWPGAHVYLYEPWSGNHLYHQRHPGGMVVRSSDLGEFRFPHQYLKFYFGQSGLELGEVRMI